MGAPWLGEVTIYVRQLDESVWKELKIRINGTHLERFMPNNGLIQAGDNKLKLISSLKITSFSNSIMNESLRTRIPKSPHNNIGFPILSSTHRHADNSLKIYDIPVAEIEQGNDYCTCGRT